MGSIWELTFSIPVWMIAAVLLVAVLGAVIMGLRKEWLDEKQALMSLIVVAITAIAGFAAIQQLSEANRLAWRGNLESRAGTLLEKSLEKDSILPCLIPTDVETIASTCAKTVYSSASTLQQASVFSGELIELLQEAEYYRDTKEETYDPAFLYWKAYLEEDPYGITAWMIQRDYGCTPDKLESCEILKWFTDPAQIKQNINEKLTETLIATYMKVDDAPLSATPAAAPAAPAAAPATPAPVTPAPAPPAAEPVPAAAEPMEQPAEPEAEEEETAPE